MQILWSSMFKDLTLETVASLIHVLYPFPICSSCLICFTGLLHAHGFWTTSSSIASLVTIMMLHCQNPPFPILPFFPCAFLLFPLNSFLGWISKWVLYTLDLGLNISILSSPTSPHQQNTTSPFILLLSAWFPFVSPCCPQAASHLPALGHSHSQQHQSRCWWGCPPQILYQWVGERNENKFSMWELNTIFDPWKGGDNQCILIHLGI